MAALFELLPGALLGAALAYILPFIIGALPYLLRARRQQRVIEGEWYSYHYTRQSDEPRIRTLHWKIKQDIRGSLTAACWDATDDSSRRPPNYGKGKAYSERGHLVLDLFSQKDHAHIACRLLEPIGTNEISAGLWLSFDLNGTLVAGPIILSRRELTSTDAESLIRSRVAALPACKLLEVPTHRKVKGGDRPMEVLVQPERSRSSELGDSNNSESR